MADTEYIIDVAADMPEAGVTTAQLDELSQSLIDAGANAESLEAATIAVGQQLKAAGEATRAANAALAEGNSRYGELERSAINAAKAAEKAALKNQGVIPPELLANARAAAAALEGEAVSLKHLESEAAAAAKAESKLANTHGNLKKLSGASSQAFSEQAAATKKSIREAEGFVPAAKQLGDFKDAMSSSEGQAILMSGAVVGVGAAVAVATVAVIAATVAIAAWAVGLADAKREAGLTSEAMQALHPELKDLEGAIARVSAETGAHNDELQEWAGNLQEAKVKAADIPAALRAMALADAALGNGGAQDLLNEIKANKGAAADLAAEYNNKLGPIVEKKMLGLTAQSAKLHKNIGDLFGGLNIDPVLEGFRVLVDLFDQNTAAGSAMKLLFEAVFQPLIDQATNAAYVVEAFVLGFLIGMTKLYIKLKPAIAAVKEFFGFDDTNLSDTLDIAKLAGEAIVPVFLGLVAVFGSLLVAVGLALAPFIALSAALYALIGAVVAVGAAVLGGFMSAWQGVKDFFANLSLADIGTNLIRGLAAGITGGASEVIVAMVNVAKGAITAAKAALGIHSPSTVFADIGGFTTEGFVQGVDGGAADAQDAMAAMVEPPAPGQLSAYDALSGNAGAAAAGDGAAVSGGAKAAGGKTINFNAPVYFSGTKATQAEVDDLAERITQILEGDAAAVAGEAA